jgi:hypothetical protein
MLAERTAANGLTVVSSQKVMMIAAVSRTG